MEARPEDDSEGECVPLDVRAEELLPLGEGDTVSVPLKESPPLAVEHALGEPELDARADIVTHPEDDIDIDCSPLAVGVGEPVRHSEGVWDRVPLGEGLPLGVRQVRGELETDAEGDRVLQAVDDCEGGCVALAVGVRELVPLGEADADSEPLGDRVPLGEELALGDLVLEAERDREPPAEADADKDWAPLAVRVSSPVPWGEADCRALPLEEGMALGVGHSVGEVEPDSVAESDHHEAEADGDGVPESVIQEGEAEGDGVALSVAVCDSVPCADAGGDGVTLEEELWLAVERALCEAEPVAVTESDSKEAEADGVSAPEKDAHEGDDEGDSVTLPDGVCDPVPCMVAVGEELLLDRGLLLAVEHALAEGEPDGVAERESSREPEADGDGAPDGDSHEGEAEGEGVLLPAGDCEAVPCREAEWEALLIGEWLLLAVEHALGEPEPVTLAEGENREGEDEGDCVPLVVGVAKKVPLGEAVSVEFPVGERLPLGVRHLLGDGEAVGVAGNEATPEGDLVGAAPLPLTDAVSVATPLAEALVLGVGHGLGELVLERVTECESTEGDAECVSVTLTVDVCRPVPLVEGDRVKFPLGDTLLLDVGHTFTDAETDGVADDEPHAEGVLDGEPVALEDADTAVVPLEEPVELGVGQLLGELELEVVAESVSMVGDAEGVSAPLALGDSDLVACNEADSAVLPLGLTLLLAVGHTIGVVGAEAEAECELEAVGDPDDALVPLGVAVEVRVTLTVWLLLDEVHLLAEAVAE